MVLDKYQKVIYSPLIPNHQNMPCKWKWKKKK